MRFEWLFSHPVEIFGSGELVWQSAWSPLVLVAVGLAFAVPWTWLALRASPSRARRARRGALLALQLAMLALVLTVLARPAWRVRHVEPGRNRVIVLLDHSASMHFGDAGGSRLARVMAAFGERAWPQIEQRFSVESYAFSSRLRRLGSLSDAPEFGPQTTLVSSLEEVLEHAQDVGAAAVVLVSDGRENVSARVARSGSWSHELASYGVPVHVIPAGRERMPEDLELVSVKLPTHVVRGSRIAAEVTLHHDVSSGEARSSDPAARTTRLVVREGERPLASREVVLDPETPLQRVRLDLDVSEAGLLDLEIALDPLPGERILANNRVRQLVDVPAQPERVLYIEGEPRWEYKFLRRALADDPGIALVSLLRTTGNKLLRQGLQREDQLAAGFPTERSELFEYDVLLIGSLEASALSRDQHALIEAFVRERGGGLLLLAGAHGLGAGGWGETRLGSVLPVELVRAVPQRQHEPARVVQPTRYGSDTAWLRLADEPRANAVQWSSLPALAEVQPLGSVKLGAVTLLEWAPPEGTVPGHNRSARAATSAADVAAESGALPLLAVQPYGRGRAAVLGAASTWQWHMQAPRGDARHARFWRQLVRALSAPAAGPMQAWIDPADEVSGDTSAAAHTSLLRVELRTDAYDPIADARVEATLTAERGGERILELRPSSGAGQYVAPLDLMPGELYRVDVRAEPSGPLRQEARVTLHHRADADAGESFHPTQDRAVLTRIAAATGGTLWEVERLGELPDALTASPRSSLRFETYDLTFMPVILIVLVMLRASEWGLRKRWGWV